MRLKLLAIFAAMTLISACASQSETDTTAASTGGTQVGAASSAPADAGVNAAPAVQNAIDTATEQYFIANVGDRVFFGFDQSDITPQAAAVLDRQAAWMRANPTVTIRVEGHADERGTREYNLALGERRANAVREYLISQNVSGGRIATISYGK